MKFEFGKWYPAITAPRDGSLFLGTFKKYGTSYTLPITTKYDKEGDCFRAYINSVERMEYPMEFWTPTISEPSDDNIVHLSECIEGAG